MREVNETQEQNRVGLTVQREARCTNDLLCCPVCGGTAVYCDDGKNNQRVDCCGDGKTEQDGCGLGVWLKRSKAEARAIWNAIPRKT